MRWFVPLSFLLVAAAGAPAQEPAQAKPIVLSVDASEAPRKIIHASLQMPVQPGPLTLYYPKWIPGKHNPAGPIPDLVGLKIQAGDRFIPWKRDEVDGYAFHCTIPQGVKEILVSLDYLATSNGGRFSPKLAVLCWDQMLLYPRGKPASAIPFQVRVRLPEGWQHGSALMPAANAEDKGWTRFETVSLEMLIDSPLLCGQYLNKIELAPKVRPPHYLVLAGDSTEAIELSNDLKASYDRLVEEAAALLGCHHYRQYHFLLALSDHVAHGGLEHHESSDNRLPEQALHDPALRRASAALLSHELFHSWNGKYRRPATMITRDFQEPHRTKLLWIYEGLTSYYDDVLAARSGLRTVAETQNGWAALADRMNNQRGRTWRPLEDTAAAAHVLYQANNNWTSWRRSLDYYDEGFLIWLDVDTRIRELTRGQKSLDDFCRNFFGGEEKQPAVKGYTLDDVAEALNNIAPQDWKTFLVRRVTLPSEHAPLDGFQRSGWKLAYTDTPTDMLQARETARKVIDLTSSIGLLLSPEGVIRDVIKGKAADKAGIGPGMKLVAVNARRWSAARLRSAIAATKKRQPLELLVENDEFFRSHRLDYEDGARYPILERLSLARTDMLADILRPRASAP